MVITIDNGAGRKMAIFGRKTLSQVGFSSQLCCPMVSGDPGIVRTISILASCSGWFIQGSLVSGLTMVPEFCNPGGEP